MHVAALLHRGAVREPSILVILDQVFDHARNAFIHQIFADFFQNILLILVVGGLDHRVLSCHIRVEPAFKFQAAVGQNLLQQLDLGLFLLFWYAVFLFLLLLFENALSHDLVVFGHHKVLDQLEPENAAQRSLRIRVIHIPG